MTKFVVRQNQRFKDTTSVVYRGHGLSGEGLLKNISLTGGQIKGTTPVTEGMVLALEIRLPTGDEPLLIDRAVVQWVKGLEFGVELKPQRDVAERIIKLIADKVVTQHGSQS
ncbi:MAG: PilZ domain-containing protein [Nitrospira sp.]